MVTKRCLVCGKQFMCKKYRAETAKYCSTGCMGAAKAGSNSVFWKGGTTRTVTRTCADCGEVRVVKAKAHESPTRCFPCDLKNRGKEKNGRWKGGVTPVNKAIRNSKRYAEWRASVFTRDGYECRFCGQVGRELHADHIMPFASHPDLRFDLANGRTLCKPCHEKTPTYRKGRLSPEQVAWREAHEADGGVYVLARSADDLEARKAEILGEG